MKDKIISQPYERASSQTIQLNECIQGNLHTIQFKEAYMFTLRYIYYNKKIYQTKNTSSVIQQRLIQRERAIKAWMQDNCLYVLSDEQRNEHIRKTTKFVSKANHLTNSPPYSSCQN